MVVQKYIFEVSLVEVPSNDGEEVHRLVFTDHGVHIVQVLAEYQPGVGYRLQS